MSAAGMQVGRSRVWGSPKANCTTSRFSTKRPIQAADQCRPSQDDAPLRKPDLSEKKIRHRSREVAPAVGSERRGIKPELPDNGGEPDSVSGVP